MITKIDARLIEIFTEIIKIDGLSQNEKDVADYIFNFLTNLGFQPYFDTSMNKTGSNTNNIICEINEGGEQLLSSHMDTARSTKNVKPIIFNDRITSDGTTVLGVDNRVGITVLLRLAEIISNDNFPINGFTLAFITCEETTLEGSRNLEIPEGIKNGFVFDSFQSPGHIINQSFGAATFKVNIFGKASHAGISPEKGINAIKIAADAINSIKQGRLSENETLNIGKISGGGMVNVVPDLVSIEGEVRSSDEITIEKQLKIVKEIFIQKSKVESGEIEFNTHWDFKPYYVSEEDETYKLIRKAIEKVGLSPIPIGTSGGSDASSFNELGIPSVNIGIGAQNPHSNDEFILLKDFQDSFNIALELVKNEN